MLRFNEFIQCKEFFNQNLEKLINPASESPQKYCNLKQFFIYEN